MNSNAALAVSALASQVGAISAFFGGVAVTLLGLLIFVKRRSHMTEVTIGAFVVGAVCFIVSALAATFLSVGMLPGASRDIASRSYLELVMLLMNSFFLIGIVSLLVGIMLSGWMRSRSTGIITTCAGSVGLIAALWLSIRIS
jgi:hypothetical protein